MTRASHQNTSHVGAELARSARGPVVVIVFFVLAELLRRGAQALGVTTWASAVGWGTAFTVLALFALARHRVRFSSRWLVTVAGAWVAAFALSWLVRQI